MVTNLIKTTEVTTLKENLSKLAALDQDGLNSLYKMSLRSDHGNDGGAGLGLIDIYRDSNSKVKFNFNKLNDTQTFYSISVTV